MLKMLPSGQSVLLVPSQGNWSTVLLQKSITHFHSIITVQRMILLYFEKGTIPRLKLLPSSVLYILQEPAISACYISTVKVGLYILYSLDLLDLFVFCNVLLYYFGPHHSLYNSVFACLLFIHIHTVIKYAAPIIFPFSPSRRLYLYNTSSHRCQSSSITDLSITDPPDPSSLSIGFRLLPCPLNCTV
ncbi:hypothetical protein HHX47_DHR4001076, partial [Lentinula edodes]